MTSRLPTEHHLESLSLKAAQAILTHYLSNCFIVGNHVSPLKFSMLKYDVEVKEEEEKEED